MRHLVSLLLHDVYEANAAESGFSDALAQRYKLRLGEFDRLLDAIDGEQPGVALVASAAGTLGTGLAVTVDDGGRSYFTLVADRLEARGWRGHAFVTTGMIGRQGFLTASDLRDLDRRGHVIGTHSATHPQRFSACPWDRMVAEWADSRSALEDVLGRHVEVGSLPGGYLSRRAARAAAEAGLRVLFTSEPVVRPWSIDGCVLLGRFTVRPGESPAALAALAAGSRTPWLRQRVWWTAKKLVKPVLGSAYPRLGAWIAAR
jgi:peptidoglycan/xylan/chitin deacetylase (PgdA/CDA1 family)